MNQTRVMSAALAAAMCLSVSMLAQSNARMGGHANALTAQEQKEGWILLFDGRSLDKWDVTPALAKVFKVGEGSIKVDLSDAGGTLLTKDTSTISSSKSNFARTLTSTRALSCAARRRGLHRRPAKSPRRIPADPATSCRFATETPAITAAAISSRAAS